MLGYVITEFNFKWINNYWSFLGKRNFSKSFEESLQSHRQVCLHYLVVLYSIFLTNPREKGISVVWNESDYSAINCAMKTLKREFQILKTLGGNVDVSIECSFNSTILVKSNDVASELFVGIFDWWIQPEPNAVVWISEMVSCTIFRYYFLPLSLAKFLTPSVFLNAPEVFLLLP